jgi:hypothetical protein
VPIALLDQAVEYRHVFCTASLLLMPYVLAGCATGPVSTTNTTPPSLQWVLEDETTHNRQTIVPAGATVTAFIAPGDEYLVVLEANAPGGVKSITLGASGESICNGNHGAYTEAHPFKYTVKSQTLVFTELAHMQVYTQALFPYFFNWDTGPAAPATSACASAVPLYGTTFYQGSATNYAGTSSGTSSLNVTTCVAGGC